MYNYDDLDKEFVQQRVDEFSAQVKRRLDGELSEDAFKPLRLQNGVYLQLHAYMLRIAIPYGELNSEQMRMLAYLAKHYDKGYGHFTTRQNIQFNWPTLDNIPAMLKHLADVNMHAIQTSGNCIRNVTSDPLAGYAADEMVDPRPIAELLRQWSSLHPEFLYLPRKFKIAVNGSHVDRAALKLHDVALQLYSEQGSNYIKLYVGGGQGRTPYIAQLLYDGLAEDRLLPSLEAIMRVYNKYGRRDNKYKARIKILVNELGIESFKKEVDAELQQIDLQNYVIAMDELARIRNHFIDDSYYACEHGDFARHYSHNVAFKAWVNANLHSHKHNDYSIVAISLKAKGAIPGDASYQQLYALADIAERYGSSKLRVTHRQNIILPHVAKKDLYFLWQALQAHNLAESNIHHASDIIACPGLDYCALATARSIPLAQELSLSLRKREERQDLSNISINISGCINACGHHHVGNIGILGLDKKGEEYYQITLGGSSSDHASIGKILGQGLAQDDVPDAINRILDIYYENRHDNEYFIDTVRRIGDTPFKEALYA